MPWCERCKHRLATQNGGLEDALLAAEDREQGTSNALRIVGKLRDDIVLWEDQVTLQRRENEIHARRIDVLEDRVGSLRNSLDAAAAELKERNSRDAGLVKFLRGLKLDCMEG